MTPLDLCAILSSNITDHVCVERSVLCLPITQGKHTHGYEDHWTRGVIKQTSCNFQRLAYTYIKNHKSILSDYSCVPDDIGGWDKLTNV